MCLTTLAPFLMCSRAKQYERAADYDLQIIAPPDGVNTPRRRQYLPTPVSCALRSPNSLRLGHCLQLRITARLISLAAQLVTICTCARLCGSDGTFPLQEFADFIVSVRS